MPGIPRPALKNIVFATLIFLLNVLIVKNMFAIQYSLYQESNEGSFIAIAKQIASDPFGRPWWPYWACGIPFQNTYLPLLHMVAGAYSRLAGLSAGLAYHQVCALCFCLSPVFVYLLAVTLSKRPIVGLYCALAYTTLSPIVWLVPRLAEDLGSIWSSRRLQIIGYYGEGPHTMALAFIPLAVLYLYLSSEQTKLPLKLLAGIFSGLAVLANAFAAVILVAACLGIIVATERARRLRVIFTLALIGIAAYIWISPLVPPSVLSAIRMNSPTVDGDFRFTLRSAGGVAAIAALVAAVHWILKDFPSYMRFFAAWACMLNGIVVLGLFRVFVVPQPHRYEVCAEMALALAVGCIGFDFCEGFSRNAKRVVACSSTLLLAFAAIYNIGYGWKLVKPIPDVTVTAPYRLAKWVDANMHGERVMISGSYSFHFNDFTDSPQLHGAQDPMLPNMLLRHAVYAIYSGQDTGDRDAEVSITWLKALGAHAISVPGPRSREYYKPFTHPAKFEGKLPVIWQEGDDRLYAVPSASSSLAHVIESGSLVTSPPMNGLDTAEAQRYVQALDASRQITPAAWQNRGQLEIDLPQPLGPGQVVSVQVSADPGWSAHQQGSAVPLLRDGLGFLYFSQPHCTGPCRVTLEYNYPAQVQLMFVLSVVEMICLAGLLARYWVKR